MITFDAKDISQYYIELDRAENHDALSDSYRTAAVSSLKEPSGQSWPGTPGREVLKLIFMLNSTENKIRPAHKC